jgi:hypothetical protein
METVHEKVKNKYFSDKKSEWIGIMQEQPMKRKKNIVNVRDDGSR